MLFIKRSIILLVLWAQGKSYAFAKSDKLSHSFLIVIPNLIDVLPGTICGGWSVFGSSHPGKGFLASNQHHTCVKTIQRWQINHWIRAWDTLEISQPTTLPSEWRYHTVWIGRPISRNCRPQERRFAFLQRKTARCILLWVGINVIHNWSKSSMVVCISSEICRNLGCFT